MPWEEQNAGRLRPLPGPSQDTAAYLVPNAQAKSTPLAEHDRAIKHSETHDMLPQQLDETLQQIPGLNQQMTRTYQFSWLSAKASATEFTKPPLMMYEDSTTTDENIKTDYMMSVLHWLPYPAQVKFRILKVVSLSLIGTTPSYLSEMLHPLSSISGRQL